MPSVARGAWPTDTLFTIYDAHPPQLLLALITRDLTRVNTGVCDGVICRDIRMSASFVRLLRQLIGCAPCIRVSIANPSLFRSLVRRLQTFRRVRSSDAGVTWTQVTHQRQYPRCQPTYTYKLYAHVKYVCCRTGRMLRLLRNPQCIQGGPRLDTS